MTRAGDRPASTLLLITGLPGSGKSTVADQAAKLLGAPVLAHDWAMSGLRPYRELQQALDSMRPAGHQPVGWSFSWPWPGHRFAGGHRSCSMAWRGLRPSTGAGRSPPRKERYSFLVLTECADPSIHRSRIEGESDPYRTGTSSIGITSNAHGTGGIGRSALT